MKHPLLQLSLVGILSFLSACSTAPQKTENAGPRVIQLNGILDSYFESYLKLDPLFATSIGDHRYDDQLPISIRPEHRAMQKALIEESLRQVRDLGCRDMPESALLNCMTFEDDLGASLALLKVDLDDQMPFNQFDSFPLDLAELASGSSYVTFESKKDYLNFMERLKKVPEYFETMETQMRAGAKKGITVPRALAQKGLKNIQSLLNTRPEENVFLKPLRKLPESITAKEREELVPAYEALIHSRVIPAYQKLAEYVKSEYLKQCRKTSGILSVPGGREYYQALVKYHTTTSLSPDEIMKIGLGEVARIKKEFEEVKHRLGYKGDLKSFFKSLRSNPALFPFKTNQEVLGGYRNIHKTLTAQIPAHFRLLPKAAFDIREVEKFKAETAGESYQNPSADGSRPGIFWVPIPDPTKYQKKSMEALFLHEAIPGHHFQIAVQQELDLPRYRKFNGNNAYVEGWGLYAESLGKDLGLYTDSYEWVGRLEYEMHRALRLVVDTGMHWKGWSRERAIRFSLDHEPMDEAGIIAEIERYMAIPGQALSYKIGELKLQELKRLAKSELGPKYNDPDFHDEILKDGALPLSVLESKIKRWISAKK